MPRIGLALALVAVALPGNSAWAGDDPPPRWTEVAIRGDGFRITPPVA